jgi:pimeloyl-ACP methyl ester carboxylesterase
MCMLNPPSRRARASIFACLLTAMAAPLAHAAPAGGSWIGQSVIEGTPYYAKLSITGDAANLHVPQIGVNHKPIRFGRVVADSLVLESGDTTLVARALGDTIVGTLRMGARSGAVRLIRYRPISDAFATYPRTYVTESGTTFFVHRLGDGLLVDDLKSGQTRGLWATSDADSDLLGVLPLDAHGPFPRTARITTLNFEWNTGGKHEIARRSHAWSEEPVRIEGAGPLMTGVVKIPNAAGPHPLIVIVPGAGDSDHSAYGATQALFAAHGFMVFAYDKRGVGGSEGDFNTAEFDSLADDVVRAVRSLTRRADVDTARVYLWGHSQGAWLAPMAARRLPHVAGLILVSYSAETPPVETIGWLERHLNMRHLTPEEIRAALDYENAAFRVVRAHGEGWDEFAALVPGARAARWADGVPLPESKDALLRWPGFFFDPIPVLRDIRVPTLVIFGARDINVNTKLGARVMRSVLGSRGTIQTYEDADHELRLFKENDLDDASLWYSPGYATGYFDAMIRWLRARPGN